MLQTLSGFFRTHDLNGFRSAALRLTCALALTLVLSVAASAYTIVMRDGRRIEIPASFTVTPTTLTYEAAPGINVTIKIVSIDIAATENANGEPGGSLLKRAAQQELKDGNVNSQAQTSRARHTLTNRDLEASRRVRQESEAAYERRRVELGLPSREEMRRRMDEEDRRMRELARQSAEAEAQAEAYWRVRATGLQTEIVALKAESDYLRARLTEWPVDNFGGSYGFIQRVVPFVPFRHGFHRPQVLIHNPHRFIGGTLRQRFGGRIITNH